jgi:tartrate dehydrogenase/decarboxylase/D-malate dehydrogenase
MSAERTHKIGVIAGDGIGKEVMPEGIRVLERAASLYGFTIDQTWHDFANCDYFAQHGQMMPDDWKDQIGTDRVLRYAFDLARTRERRHVTSATKSNGLAISMPWWDERVEAMSDQYPDVTHDKYHIDILTAQFVMNPDRFDVVVASNLFGDILSDLGPACTGTIGVAPSANINPERTSPSLFEPVHGSAPDIAGKNIANPIGQIWSAAMMLEHLGEAPAAAAIMQAIETVLAEPGLRTRDLKGQADTAQCGAAVADAIAAPAPAAA